MAFVKTSVEFFQKTSLNGFGLLYYIRRRKYQRLFWFLFILMGIGFATYVVLVTLLNFLHDPTVTELESQNYPIWQIPFPAIAICSVNKLSLFAVRNYLQETFNGNNVKINDGMLKMKLFSGYFDTSSVDFDEAAEFQNELEQSSPFNTPTILKSLAPSCYDLLKICYWNDILTDCNELFFLEETAEGFCCVFNHNKSKENMYLIEREGIGVINGLTVVLNTSTIDYYLTDRSTSGFILQIFNPRSFPDPSVGGVKELFLGTDENIDVQLFVTKQIATDDVRSYAVEKRHCLFEDEHDESYELNYTQADCLSKCKFNSMLMLCGCVPYYAPNEYMKFNSNVTYCTLANLECLERHRITWQTHRSTDYYTLSNSLQQSLQDALNCPNCLPLCSYDFYYQRHKKSKLNKSLHTYRREILNQYLNTTNISLIKLYFSKPFAQLFRKKVAFNWYQILSNIGGVIGICMGCSFISGFEIIYFSI
ncbi:pickpocket protein 11, partial [Teleopsis dalmanni]|uniref:pickpocket protein 11 n=1 Tax=Teleopsis dalmanni TaxID=139649 RepID=UPI0018CF6076